MKKFFVALTLCVFINSILGYAQIEYPTGYISADLYNQNIGYYKVEETPVLFNDITLMAASEASEEKYISPYVSPAKNQGSGNTCWAFSMAGAIESYLIKDTYEKTGVLDTKAYDFSENHMQYMVSDRNNNPFGHDVGIGVGSGGNALVVSPYLINRRGPVYNSDDVYIWTETSRDYSESANIPLGDYIVREIIQIPELSDSDSIGLNSTKLSHINDEKKLIKNYGSSVCGINTSGFSGLNNSHCYIDSVKLNSASKTNNHMVLAVGWDDNYPKENFKRTYDDGSESMPEGDGAFIIKNSWGTSVGENGLFYLSYYDFHASRNLWAISSMEKRKDGQLLYSHDDYFPIGAFNFNTDTVYYGNQFERKTNKEYLDEIIFYAIAGYEYEFYLVENELTTSCYDGYVMLDTDNAINLTDKKHTYSYNGYYTVDVPDTMIDSEKFSVIVRESTTNGTVAWVFIEMNYEYFEATAEPMQSFSYSDMNGIFEDIGESGYNVPVKAVTKTDCKYSEISFVNFTDDEKTEKSVFTEGDTVNIAAVVDGVNLDNSTLVCGIYKDNKLIKILDKVMENKGNVFRYEDIPQDFSEYTVKVFAIDSYGRLTPLGNTYSK